MVGNNDDGIIHRDENVNLGRIKREIQLRALGFQRLEGMPIHQPQSALCRNVPKRMVLEAADVDDVVSVQATFLLRETLEGIAIEAIEPISGTDPQKTLCILCGEFHRPGRQSLLERIVLDEKIVWARLTRNPIG